MILKKQGYYKEMLHGDDTDLSILEYIHKKISNKKEICQYLRSGYVLAACGSVVKDVICPGKGVIGSPDELTDGTWIWPADLAYYVENYDLELDQTFVKHMSDNSWKIPEGLLIDEDDIEVI